MCKKCTPSSSNQSKTTTNIVNWVPIDSYLIERTFPHLFRLTIQQMRLQRALIRFLADEEKTDTSRSSSLGASLKSSIIEEKQRLLRLLNHHVNTLHSIAAPYLITEGKLKMVEAVKESIKKLESTKSEDVLKSTLEDLSNSTLAEYLDLVTGFVGDDSNWPVDVSETEGEDFVNRMLCF